MKCGVFMSAFVLLSGSVASGWNDYDPCDFAVEVVSYIEGADVRSYEDPIDWEYYNDPTAALGRPTAITTGDDYGYGGIPIEEDVVVVPVYPPFRSFEIVSIGNGSGALTLKFNHRVADDENNPYGIDLIVFGNSRQSGAGWWMNGNPEGFGVFGDIYAERGIVSVSQDGQTWYTFSNGPYADDFAATAGFDWDEDDDVWGDELNPTRPIDPALTAADYGGMTLAEMIDAYDGSAGGTGFDIAELGLDWIEYVRISDNPVGSTTSEVDAVADVSCCGDYRHRFPPGDITRDCWVDEYDLVVLLSNWLADGDCEHGGVAPAGDVDNDCRVDLDDFEVLSANWLKHTWQWD